ncbi:DUF6071 family protein [Streptomyces sp. NPDC020983]|uniref:DUF6071 family protein n=1 Tax=Streptomyces sp. NPDC020983 TaxID=3365106 RepID=UPI0037B6BC41
MYLYANGCSLTYGSELHDDPRTKVCDNDRYRWTHAWPNRLAELAGAVGVHNDGVPSGSNDRIVRTTIEFLARWQRAGLPAGALMVVIGWSHPARREFYVADGYRQILPGHYYDLRGLDRLVAAYRRSAVSPVEQSWRLASQAGSLAAVLRDLGTPFVFFNAITATPLPRQLAGSFVEEVFAPERFLGARDAAETMAGFLRGKDGAWRGQHPSESGHDAWARRMYAGLSFETPETVTFDAVTAAGFPALGGTVVTHRHDRKGLERVGRLVRGSFGLRGRRTPRPDPSDRFIYP